MKQLTPAARRYLLHVGLLTFGLAVSGLYFNLVLVELGYDRVAVPAPIVGELSLLGVLNSLPVLVAGLSSLPLWWLVGLVGPRAALIAAALLHAASLLAVALWPAPLPLLLGTALGGPASVLFQVSAAPFMMRHSREAERDALFSLSAGLNIGVAGLGALAGGLVPGAAAALLGLEPQGAASYRAAFAVAAALVALSVVPLLGVGRAPRPGAAPAGGDEAGGGDGRAPGGLAGRPPMEQLRFFLGLAPHALRFMVSPLLISCGAALLIPFLSLYFRQRFGAPDAALGVIFAAISVATGLATLAAPALSSRLGQMRSVVVTQALAIPCLLLLGAAPALWLAVPIAVARGALMNMASPLYDAYAMGRTPEGARPMVIGLINGAFSAGYIVGPNISAAVQAQAGFGPLFLATAGCYALAALANYLLFLRGPAAPGEAGDDAAAQTSV